MADKLFDSINLDNFPPDNKNDNVPKFYFESVMASMERTIKRLWILCIIIFLALVITNAGWIMYESQFTDEVITQDITQDATDGGTNSYEGTIVGGDYGETEDKNNS